MNVTLTETAADYIRAQIESRGKGLGIRLKVRTTGCSGLAYEMEFVDTPIHGDRQFSHHGVSLYVDPKSLNYLDGTELDFEREGLNEGIRFNNPNSKGECGCGESFYVQ